MLDYQKLQCPTLGIQSMAREKKVIFWVLCTIDADKLFVTVCKQTKK